MFMFDRLKIVIKILQRSASIQPRTSPKYEDKIPMIVVVLIFSPDILSTSTGT